MMRKLILVALLAISVACGKNVLVDITAPSTFSKTLTYDATATAYASCANGTSAYASARIQFTVTGTGASQAEADADAEAKQKSKLAEEKAKVDAVAIVNCGSGGGTVSPSPIPTPVPTPSPAPVTINVTPKTASCVVGGQMTFGASVSGSTNTAVQWTSTDPSVASVKSTSQNQVVLDCLKAGSVTVRATSVADSSKSDTATGTVTNGSITCTWTVPSGLQPDGSVQMNRGTTLTATATCTNLAGATFLPAWFSSDPSRVGVRGNSQTTIGGARYETGNTATISAVFTGQAIVSVQPAIDLTSPSYSRTVVVR